MHAFRVLFAAFTFCFLTVTAVPLTRRTVNVGDVHIGHVFVADPNHHHPPGPHPTTAGDHPVIALGAPNHLGMVHVAPVSRAHPIHMGNANHNAALYTQHTEKKFREGSEIAVGGSRMVHVNHLTRVEATSNMPNELHMKDAHQLKLSVDDHIKHHGWP